MKPDRRRISFRLKGAMLQGRIGLEWAPFTSSNELRALRAEPKRVQSISKLPIEPIIGPTKRAERSGQGDEWSTLEGEVEGLIPDQAEKLKSWAFFFLFQESQFRNYMYLNKYHKNKSELSHWSSVEVRARIGKKHEDYFQFFALIFDYMFKLPWSQIFSPISHTTLLYLCLPHRWHC